MQLLLIGLIAWFSAQLVKFSIRAFSSTPDWRLFYQSGGMPSAHSATVIAVTLAAMITEGLASPVFGLAAIFAAVVIYDSLGIRRASGEHSLVLNALIKVAGTKTKPVRELMGHTPKEVAAGSLLGVAVALIATFNVWSEHAGWLVSRPTEAEKYIYLSVFIGLAVVALIKRLILSRYRQVDVIKQLKSTLWWSIFTPAAIGLFTSLLQFQVRGAGSWRLWSLLALAGFLLLQVWLLGRLYRFAPTRYRDQRDHLLQRRKAERKKPRRKKRKR